jgi:hypothetical protein
MALERIFNCTLIPNKALRKMFSLNSTSIQYFVRLSCLMCSFDTIARYQDLEAFYSDSGVFPSSLYTAFCYEFGICDFDFTGGKILTKFDHCLHLASGDADFQRLLFAVTFVIAIWSAYKPKTWRLATVYILVSSMHRRNHFINDKGSMTLRIMQLWATLLSYDLTVEGEDIEEQSNCFDEGHKKYGEGRDVKERAGRQNLSDNVPSSSSVGFIFQVCMIYWFSALYKYAPSADDSWTSGNALDIALSFKEYSSVLGELLLRMPPVVRVALTHASGILECVGPFVFMSPFHTSFFRGLGFVLFVGFHLGIGLTMNLGIFPIYSCFLFVPLIPREWWKYRCLCHRQNISSPSSKISKDTSGSNGSSEKCAEKAVELNSNYSRKNHGETIIQQISVVFISLLIFWWQASNIENGIQVPRIVREACAVVGVKQHWKLFTNLTSSMTGNFDCKPFVVGVLTNKGGGATSMEEIGKENHNYRHVNLLNWRERQYINNFTSFESIEGLLTDQQSPNQNKIPFLSSWTTARSWNKWTQAMRSNDYGMMSTGDYFCKLWNHNKKINIVVTMDGNNVKIEFGLKFDDVVSAAKNFCMKYRMSTDQCQQLYESMEEKRQNERLDSYYYLSVCEFGNVHGIKQSCFKNDERSSLDKDSRGLPDRVHFVLDLNKTIPLRVGV